MKISLIIISLLFNLPCSAQDSALIKLVNSSAVQKTFSSINEYDFFEGISLGQLPINVSFDSISISSDQKIIFISGKILDYYTNESLPNVLVTIGNLDSTKEVKTIVPNTSTRSNIDGFFTIKSEIKPTNKLFFSSIGFLVKIYNIGSIIEIKN
ncbi:MAG: hypothetical protein Q8N83_13350 [Ignavibacteria bacterium]|nr:hypothetical protein [Ignavibacteria bacterium]